MAIQITVKRGVDVVVSIIALGLTSPILLLCSAAIWLQDLSWPFYVAPRLRAPGVTFAMVKLRTMVVDGHQFGGTSTSASDKRITPLGRFARKLKLDELPQMWNVLRGDMSLVGPRPQVTRDALLYTDEELRLFNVKPGITDFSSIVFADEAEILRNHSNPDLSYQQLIRPWKSRLGLLYVERQSLGVDVALLSLTAVALVSRRSALAGVARLIRSLGADERLADVASRKTSLMPFAPPGASVVETRY